MVLIFMVLLKLLMPVNYYKLLNRNSYMVKIIYFKNTKLNTQLIDRHFYLINGELFIASKISALPTKSSSGLKAFDPTDFLLGVLTFETT